MSLSEELSKIDPEKLQQAFATYCGQLDESVDELRAHGRDPETSTRSERYAGLMQLAKLATSGLPEYEGWGPEQRVAAVRGVYTVLGVLATYADTEDMQAKFPDAPKLPDV